MSLPYIGPHDLPKKRAVGQDRYGRQKDPVTCYCTTCKQDFLAFSVLARFCPKCSKSRRRGERRTETIRKIDIQPPGRCRICLLYTSDAADEL